jgi:glycosyltransferase involved in cell wall biosynthesis
VLTAYVCGRDQGLTLERCFNSLKGVDELIYIDGGSKDSSVAIAKKHNAIVLKCKGKTASEQRGMAGAVSSNPYVMWLSPDDVLEKGGVKKINDKVATSTSDLISLVVKDGICHFDFPRIAKREVKYIGRAHEYPEAKTIDTVNVSIEHKAGPWHLNPTDPDGVLKLLWQDMKEMPDNPRWVYYYAREWWNRGRLFDAIHWFEKRVEKVGFPAEMADAYLYLARCYTAIGNGEKARAACLSAISINANFKEAILFLIPMLLDSNKDQWQRMADAADNSNVLFRRVG